MLPATRKTLKKAFHANSFRPFSTPNGKSKNGKPKEDDPLIKNAPNWDEKDATESEADVKADRDHDDPLSNIEKKSTNWFKEQKKK